MFEFGQNILSKRRLLQGGAPLVFISLCALLVVVNMLGWLANDLDGAVSCGNFKYADMLKINLPAGATVLKEQCSESFNPLYEVAFMMQAKDLAVFQQF